jgi:hypothetical protein
MDYEELLKHVGHKIVCVAYGMPSKLDRRTYLRKTVIRKKTVEEQLPANVAVECDTCHVVIMDFDRPDKETK